MTVDLALAQRDAIAAMLAPLTNYQIFTGKVTAPDSGLVFPYLTVWSTPGRRDLINLTGNLIDLTTITQITATGRDETEVIAALGRAADLLVGKKPSIDGRITGFIRQVNEDPFVLPVDDVHTPEGQATYQCVGQFAVTSSAAPAA